MAETNFTRAPRPTSKRRRVVSEFAEALRDTLKSGDAVAIPINGETYAVVRNRKAANAYYVAKRANAKMRSAQSEDGISLLLWLEPKESVQ